MIRRIALVLAILCALIPIGGSTEAYQCVAGDPRAALEGSDAAVIGRPISRHLPERGSGGFGEDVTYRFRVEETVKGRVKGVLVVKSRLGAIGAPVGKDVGLFLQRREGVWTSSACQQIAPDVLRRVAAPRPAPDSTGPVSFLIGGEFGDVRTIALDRDARVVAYGKGEGSTAGLAVCEGSRRVVEVVRGGVPGNKWSVGLAVREMDTLKWTRESRLEELETVGQPTWFPDAVSCRDATGNEVFVVARNNSDELLKVIRVHGPETSVVFEGLGRTAAFSTARDVAYLAAEKSIVELDMRNGRTPSVWQLPLTPREIALNPSESLLAGTSVSGWPKGTVFTMDVKTGRVSTARGYSGWPVWLDDSKFVVIPGEGEIRAYDDSVRMISSWTGWSGYPAVAVNGDLFSAGGGRVVTASALRGRVRTIRDFDSPLVHALAHVPAGPTRPAAGVRPGPLAIVLALLTLIVLFGLRHAKASRRRP